jgi:hypothetical protein
MKGQIRLTLAVVLLVTIVAPVAASVIEDASRLWNRFPGLEIGLRVRIDELRASWEGFISLPEDQQPEDLQPLTPEVASRPALREPQPTESVWDQLQAWMTAGQVMGRVATRQLLRWLAAGIEL